jgi:hypothetical protein
LRAKYIKSTNDTNYIILPKGKSKAIEILEGKSTTKTSTAKKSSYNINEDEKTVDNNKKSKTISQPIKFVDLKFEINEMKSFTDYFKSKSPKTQNDEVAIAIQWFEDNKDSTGATIEEISYLIKIATNKVPLALGQVLINMKGPKLNLAKKDEKGKYTLTSLGVLHVNGLSQSSK